MKIDKVVYRQESSVAIHGELCYMEMGIFGSNYQTRHIHLKKSGDDFYPIVYFTDTGESIYQEGIRELLILGYERSKQHETNTTI